MVRNDWDLAHRSLGMNECSVVITRHYGLYANTYIARTVVLMPACNTTRDKMIQRDVREYQSSSVNCHVQTRCLRVVQEKVGSSLFISYYVMCISDM